MPTCPGCQHQVPLAAAYCSVCGAFVGSPRDLAALACFSGTLLSILGICLLINMILPNLSLARAIDGVKRLDVDGMKKLKQDFEHGSASIKSPGLGWDAEKFGEIVLVSFSYVSTQDEQPKRYMAWWVFDPGDGTTKIISNAAEFIDGFLLRRGLTGLFPEGVLPPPPEREKK